MGFGIRDRAHRRWPNAYVPYEIDPVAYPPGSDGETQILAALSLWQAPRTIMRFGTRTNEDDYIRFTEAAGSCRSKVGRHGGGQDIPCELVINPSSVPGAGIALARQTETVFTGAFIDAAGAVRVTFAKDLGLWHPPIPIGGPLAPPGGDVALCKQGDEILVVAYIDNTETLCVGWVTSTDKWSSAVPVSGPSAPSGGPPAPPGGCVALAEQAHDVLVAAYVGTNFEFNVAWVSGTGSWNPAIPLGGQNPAPGSPVALSKQGDKLLVGMCLNADGAVMIAWVEDVGQQWKYARPIGGSGGSPGHFSIPRSGISVAEQAEDVLVAAFFDTDGNLNVSWVESTNDWQGPVRVGGVRPAPLTGGRVALAKQTDETIVAAYINDMGTVSVAWAEQGGSWNPAVPVGAPIAPGGARLALARQETADDGGSDILTLGVFAPNAPGSGVADMRVAWVVDRGTWNPPSLLHPNAPGFRRRGLTHELGHAVGLYHEQQRPDRDLFIDVDESQIRIPPGEDEDRFLDANFNIHEDELKLGPYDCSSIMHYGSTAFGKPLAMGGFATTMSIVDPASCPAIGTAANLSPTDIEAVRLCYQGELAPPGSPVGLARLDFPPEAGTLLKIMCAAFIDNAGRLCVASTQGDGWNPPMAVETAAVAPPGGHVALFPQTDERLVAAFIGSSQRLTVMSGAGGEDWTGPFPVGGPLGVPGSPVALGRQGRRFTTAAFIGNDGVLRVAWVKDTERWKSPVPVGGVTGPAGATVALLRQSESTFLAAFIDDQGRLAVAWADDANAWNPAIAVTGPIGLATASGIAMGEQADGIVTAAFFDQSGQLQLATTSGGPWTLASPPLGITAAAGSSVALSRQSGDIFTCAYVNSGVLTVAAVLGTGAWLTPQVIGGLQPPTSGARITLRRQSESLLLAAFVGTDGVLTLGWVQGAGSWHAAVHV